MDERGASFTPWNGDAYANDIYRGAVDAIARNIAKLKGQHVIASGELRRPGNDVRVNRLLQLEPNAYMNAYDFLYKVATHYFLNNNAFILMQKDEGGTVTALYPINCTNADYLADERGDLYVAFRFARGNVFTFSYKDVIHLRRHFNANDLCGDQNDALAPAIELAHTQNQGIINSIKSAANIKGILQFTQIIAPEKQKEERDRFINDYLGINNNGGVVVTDPKTTYTPITSQPAVIDSAQLAAVKDKIYNYLGVCDEIVSSKFTEDTWAAFYESVLEPFAVQISLEFTRKLFTPRELAFGNSVMFETNRLQFSSNKTKIELIRECMPYGLLTINQALDVLNLPPVEDGDRRLQTLNVIDSAKANQYQVGDTTKKEEEKKETEKEVNKVDQVNKVYKADKVDKVDQENKAG